MKEILGWIAMIATCIQVLYGMAMQARKVKVEKSAKGLSMAAVASAGFGFLMWTSWALVPPDFNWFIAVPNGLGVFFTLLILWRVARLKGPEN